MTSNLSKLESLHAQLPDGRVLTHQWLRVNGYPRPLVEGYAASGQLDSPARGVFARPGSSLTWQSVLASLQFTLGYDAHVGGRTALALHGFVPGEITTVTLIGGGAQATIADTMGLPQKFEFLRGRRLGLPSLFADGDTPLIDRGLVLLDADRPQAQFAASLPERAMVEVLLHVAGAESVLDADAIMGRLTDLQADLVMAMLMQCPSAQTRRLYFALAERHGHTWVEQLDAGEIDFGNGTRDVTPGGWLHPKYGVTLPAALSEPPPARLNA